jgi:hypothetical protein
MNTDTLDTQRAAYRAAVTAHESAASELERVRQLRRPADESLKAVAELRQKRTDLLSALMMSGTGKLTSPELTKLDAAIAAAADDERRAEDFLVAHAEAMRTLREQADACRARADELRFNVLMQQHASAEAEMAATAAEVLAAVQTLRNALGRLAGMGNAHANNADLMKRRFGVNVPVAGVKYPATLHGLQIGRYPGIPGLGDISIDTADVCRESSAAALKRWASIGDEQPAELAAYVPWPPAR